MTHFNPFKQPKTRPFENNFTELRAILPHPPQFVEFRISQTLLWALIISLLLHLLLLLRLHWKTPPISPLVNAGSQQPLTVNLNPNVPLTATRAAPAPKNTATQTERILSVPVIHPTPHALVLPPHSTRHPVVRQPVPRPPTVRPSPSPRPNPATTATDMSSYIKMQRARNHANNPDEDNSADDNNDNSASNSGKDARMARITKNLQDDGGGGIFQITSMNSETATFIFRGWDHATWSNPIKQTFMVQATDNVDVEHAIVRKMIAIIREKHPGDFDWESRRLGRVVTLSAAPENNAGLEAFLLKEFFYDYSGNGVH
jgi:hypothetical protein